jgi:hypothetical protein
MTSGQHRTCRLTFMPLVMLVLALLALPAISAAQVVEGDGTDRWLKLAWMVGAGHITGRIYNEYVHPAERIRLVVEARDASDNLVSQRYEWVGGIVPALGDRYFDVPTPGVAHHYRVAVASYTFKRGP